MAFMTALGMMTRVLVKQFLDAARLFAKTAIKSIRREGKDVRGMQHVWHQRHERFEPAIEHVVRSSL